MSEVLLYDTFETPEPRGHVIKFVPQKRPNGSNRSRALVKWKPCRPPCGFRGTTLLRNRPPVGPHSRPMPRAIYGVPRGGGCYL